MATKTSPLIEIIDLDALDAETEIGEKERSLTLDFFVLYIKGRMRHDEFITLKCWLGLLDEILPLKQRTHPKLPLSIAAAMYSTDLSFLVGAAIMCSEIIRVFTLEEQELLIQKLSRI